MSLSDSQSDHGSLHELNSSDEFEAMDLHKACRLGDLRAIEFAVRAEPDKINSKDANVDTRQLGWAPLYRAVICGHIPAVEFLLEEGADPNVANNVNSTQLMETPLHHVAENNNLELAELLLKHRADPNSQQSEGDTPLHLAVFRGDEKMVELLLKSGADANVQNFLFGQTPLHYAVEFGYLNCTKMIVEHGGDALLMDKTDDVRDLLKRYETEGLCPNQAAYHDIDEGSGPPDPCSPEEIPSFSQSEIEENFSRRMDLRDLAPVIETFGKTDSRMSSLKSNSMRLKLPTTGRIEPDAEKSLSRSKRSESHLKPLNDWLEKRNLVEIYGVLVAAGYDDVDSMIDQMRSPLPLSEDSLMEIGVRKPGHRVRLIMRLEEEAGLVAKKSKRRTPSASSKPAFLSWCSVPSNATFGTVPVTPLKDWLRQIKLEHLYDLFLSSGYDDFESLLAQMTWRSPITDQVLEKEIGIEKPGYRSRILSKLQEEVQGINRSPLVSHGRSESTPNVSLESGGKFVACDFCDVF